MTARISKLCALASLLLPICAEAAPVDSNAISSPVVAPAYPPRPDFAAANPDWIYNPDIHCWALDNSHQALVRFTWTGGCTNNQITGTGVLVWLDYPTGSRKVTGTFTHGVLNGRGRVEWSATSFSEGTFVNGELEGTGGQNWSDNDRYRGEFHNGKPGGHGHRDYPDGSSYDGEFKNGGRHGHGKWIFSGGVYDGEFRDNEIGGHGILRRPDGSRIEGEAEPARSDPAYPSTFAYPPLSRRLSEQGSVGIVFMVLPNGHTDNVKLFASSGFSRLDAAALEAVTNWRLTPARIGNLTIAVPKIQVVSFRLQG